MGGDLPSVQLPVPGCPPHPPLPSCLPSAIKGWFSPYHRKRQFGNPRNMESFGSKVLKYVVLGAKNIPPGCLRGSGRGPRLSSGVPRRRELDPLLCPCQAPRGLGELCP